MTILEQTIKLEEYFNSRKYKDFYDSTGKCKIVKVNYISSEAIYFFIGENYKEVSELYNERNDK